MIGQAQEAARALSPSGPSMDGARVLVLGSGPMGVATARAALSRGAEVTLAGRDSQRLDHARAALPAARLEVTDPEDPARLAALARAVDPDHVAVLLGGATPSTAFGIGDTPIALAQQSFSRFWASYCVLGVMAGRDRPERSVTLLSGSSSRRPSDGRGFWGSLHGSIEALGRNAAWELAPLRVNVVSPGGINVEPALRPLIPRVGRADDIAATVLLLMTSPVTTGALIDVDGGEFLGGSES